MGNSPPKNPARGDWLFSFLSPLLMIKHPERNNSREKGLTEITVQGHRTSWGQQKPASADRIPFTIRSGKRLHSVNALLFIWFRIQGQEIVLPAFGVSFSVSA